MKVKNIMVWKVQGSLLEAFEKYAEEHGLSYSSAAKVILIEYLKERGYL